MIDITNVDREALTVFVVVSRLNSCLPSHWTTMAVFVCPNCSHTQVAPDEYVGRIAKCLKCETRGEVTKSKPKPPPTPASTPPTPQPKLPSDVLVTTGDLKEDYEVIGPVYFQVSNKGIFSSALSKLAKHYEAEIAQMKKQGQMGQFRADWGFLYGEYSVGQTDFEKAFYIAVQELKKRATLLGAHAIVSMRQDIDLDTNTFQFFYLQMYGTAVRFK